MSRLVALLAAVAVGAASAPAAAFTARDALGREVRLAAPPTRIVSLVPSATEILFALGAQDRLVGRTDFCDWPPAARAKPSVGGMVAPSLEALAALRPDLVLVTPEGNSEQTFAALRRLSIALYAVAAHTLDDVARVVRGLGELTGRSAAVGPLLARLHARVEAVRRAVAGRPRPRVLYVLWPEPLIVPGRAAMVTELIRVAGGDPVTAGEGGDYPRLGLEAAVARQPEVIVLASHGAGTGPAAAERWQRLRSLPAVRAGRLHTVEGDLLHRYGPRVADGLAQLARAIHPEAFR